ncbi:MAG: PIN domain-containing protein [Proteobacteria bacterium]|nr:PIN domain-containing protein [Pseudomonadota bacterium]
MKLLFDTNIVLDVLMDRKPFADSASALFAASEEGAITGYLCGTTLTTIYYIVSKAMGSEQAKEAIKKLLVIFQVALVNRVVIEKALASDFKDFEDAVLHASACYAGVDAIVTRNEGDFSKADIPIYSPVHAEKIVNEIVGENEKEGQ